MGSAICYNVPDVTFQRLSARLVVGNQCSVHGAVPSAESYICPQSPLKKIRPPGRYEVGRLFCILEVGELGANIGGSGVMNMRTLFHSDHTRWDKKVTIPKVVSWS